jgi:hypothetical protein
MSTEVFAIGPPGLVGFEQFMGGSLEMTFGPVSQLVSYTVYALAALVFAFGYLRVHRSSDNALSTPLNNEVAVGPTHASSHQPNRALQGTPQPLPASATQSGRR